MKLTFLGTGTPHPLADRAGSSAILEIGEDRILIDCGPGSAARLIQSPYAPTELTHCLLTHLHYDHCVDFACIHLWRWDQGAGEVPPLRLAGPSGTRAFHDSLFGPNGAYAPDIAARTEHPLSQAVYEDRGGVLPRKPPAADITELEAGITHKEKNWILQVTQGIHAEPYLTCLAYRIEAGDQCIVFTGDSGPTPKLESLARDADVLVHMCHFQNNDQIDPRLGATCSGHLDAARTAAAAGVKTLVLNHITPELEDPNLQKSMKEQASDIFDGPIHFAEDLLELEVGSNRPTS